MYDYLIVGSGLYGSVFAREATNKGYKCLVIDKRDNVGGNIYTEKVEGINVHKYGAHIFHTNNQNVWIILLSSLHSIALPIRLWLITKANCTHCLSTCIHLIRCGV